MAKGVNKVMLIGNIGSDIDVRQTTTGVPVVNVSLATSDSWKDKTTGKINDKTEWHRIVFYNKLAEIAAQYLTKGMQIYVEGSIRTSKWQDKQGVDRYKTEIVAMNMQMLGGKKDNDESSSQSNLPFNDGIPF
jgi:single-strand DNA-binding protein